MIGTLYSFSYQLLDSKDYTLGINAGHSVKNHGGDNGEYGAKTGGPRKMGWFDVVASKYGCMLQGTTEISLSLLEVLGYLDEIPV